MQTKTCNQKKKNNLRMIAVALGLLLVCAAALYFGAKAVFPLPYESEIRAWAEEYEVDPYLIMGIIRAESGFREDAISSAEAIGLMQITEKTGEHIAAELGVEDFSPEQLLKGDYNIRFGVWYVKWLSDQFDGDGKNTLAAYNAGIGTVKGWLSDSRYSQDGLTLTAIPFRETSDFVGRVNVYSRIYRLLYGS